MEYANRTLTLIPAGGEGGVKLEGSQIPLIAFSVTHKKNRLASRIHAKLNARDAIQVEKPQEAASPCLSQLNSYGVLRRRPKQNHFRHSTVLAQQCNSNCASLVAKCQAGGNRLTTSNAKTLRVLSLRNRSRLIRHNQNARLRRLPQST